MLLNNEGDIKRWQSYSSSCSCVELEAAHWRVLQVRTQDLWNLSGRSSSYDMFWHHRMMIPLPKEVIQTKGPIISSPSYALSITLIFHFLAEVVPTVTIRTRGSVELPGPASIYLRAVPTKWRILNIVKNVNVCKEDEQWIWFGWYFNFKVVLTCASLCSHHIQGWLCFRWNIYVQILLSYSHAYQCFPDLS